MFHNRFNMSFTYLIPGMIGGIWVLTDRQPTRKGVLAMFHSCSSPLTTTDVKKKKRKKGDSSVSVEKCELGMDLFVRLKLLCQMC